MSAGFQERSSCKNNYGSDQTLTSDGSFSFRVASSAKYYVRVKTQPNGKCTVSNGSGTVSADVDNVSVGCWVFVDGGGMQLPESIKTQLTVPTM